MSSFSNDTLNSKQEQEFANLKKNKSRRILRLTCLFILAYFSLFMTYHSLISRGSKDVNLIQFRKDFASDYSVWAKDLSVQQEKFQDWLVKRGTAGEVSLFNSWSESIFSSAAFIQRNVYGTENGFVFRLAIGLHYAFMRIAFLIIASWRLWLIVVLFSGFFGWFRRKPYIGDDMLGQTGNGRMFYSGIRAGLDNLSPEGAPDKQVRGLACPQTAPLEKVKTSGLGKILYNFGVANDTNLGLASIIIHYSSFPAYVTTVEEAPMLEGFFKSANLEANAEAILERVLDLHQFYIDGQKDPEFNEFLDHFEEDIPNGEKIDSLQYSRMLQQAMHRVLTPKMRETISQIPSAQIATIILAYEAGKTMAYGFEGGSWQKKSNYPQLTARSIMHSVTAYGTDYDFISRMNIRCALIFGARFSAFGPIKMPVNISEEAVAGRQWVELLMAAPHELEHTANEVEMFAIVRETHGEWQKTFLDSIVVSDPEIVNKIYATPGNLFLIPSKTLIAGVKKAISQELLLRLEDLITKVTQRQRLQTFTTPDGTESAGVPAYARVHSHFSNEEAKALCEKYNLTMREVMDWSSLRIVLNNYGWLARRVGDYTVSENSLIYAILKTGSAAEPGANILGLIGIPGMIPLRATRFAEKWGKSWQNRFKMVLGATMAENKVDYEKLMRGIDDKVVDDFGGPSSGIF